MQKLNENEWNGHIPPARLIRHKISEVESWYKDQKRYRIPYDDSIGSYHPYYEAPCGGRVHIGMFFNNFLAKQRCYECHLFANDFEKYKGGFVDVRV